MIKLSAGGAGEGEESGRRQKKLPNMQQRPYFSCKPNLKLLSLKNFTIIEVLRNILSSLYVSNPVGTGEDNHHLHLKFYFRLNLNQFKSF
jgi:hypothetical protein